MHENVFIQARQSGPEVIADAMTSVAAHTHDPYGEDLAEAVVVPFMPESPTTAEYADYMKVLGFPTESDVQAAITDALDRLPTVARAVIEGHLGYVAGRAGHWRERYYTLAGAVGKDTLTGLYGRADWEAAASRADQDPTKTPCCFDVGNLTLANNTSGHAAGDEILRRGGTAITDAGDWCNQNLVAVDKDGAPLPNQPRELVPDRLRFHQSGDEYGAIVENVDVLHETTDETTGEVVATVRPLAEVFIEKVSESFGTVMFCGPDRTRQGNPVILGVCSMSGGYGEKSALADLAATRAKTAGRASVIDTFLQKHSRPAVDDTGRVVHIAGNTAIINGTPIQIDQIMVDKLTVRQLPPVGQPPAQN